MSGPTIYSRVMDIVGDGTVGGRSVPTTWRSDKRVTGPNEPDLYAASDNDAFGLTLRHIWEDSHGNRDEVGVTSLNRAEARWLSWYIVRWFAADWFGLRRRIYYWALHRHLERPKGGPR